MISLFRTRFLDLTQFLKFILFSNRAFLFIHLIFLSMFCSIGFTNGFKIQEQSLNGTALNSAYVAGSRGADSSYYNPANMGFKNNWGKNDSEFELAVSLIQIPGFEFQVPTTNQGLRSSTSIKLKSGVLENIINAFSPSTLNPEFIHSQPDSQIVRGSTGTTNFILPKFFYKTRTKNNLTFGASFTAPSGLAMQWKDKGGEFLQDVFIMMVELSPSMSYTIKDRFSIGISGRVLYAMGSFNNVVYVPMTSINEQGNKVNSSITLTGQELQEIGIEPLVQQGLLPSSIQPFIGLTGIDALVESSTTTLYGTSKVYQRSQGKDLSGGYRISASLRVFENGMFSAVYNSAVKFQMQGSLEATTYIGGTMGNVLTQTNLDIAVNLPPVLILSYAHDFFNHRLRIEGVYERTFWARGPNFKVTPDFDNATYTGLSGLVQYFSSEKLKSMVGLADFSAVSNMGAGWKDTNTYRLGFSWLDKSYVIMGSVAYDEAPSPQDSIGIPDSNGYMFSLGGKYRFKDFILGVAYSLTIKDNRQSLYQQPSNLGQLRILTASLEYHW